MKSFFKKLMLVLVSFASGTLLGGAFFHLIPESLSPVEENVLLVLVSGIVVFFLLEKFLWRHCHERECPIHPFAYLNLVGDGIHNFIDGLIIAAGFLAPPSPNFSLGSSPRFSSSRMKFRRKSETLGYLFSVDSRKRKHCSTIS